VGSGLEQLARLRDHLERENRVPSDVVEAYIQRLDELVVWGAEEFDVALSSNWKELQNVVERYFTVATVVREHPRATFDRAKYVANHRDFSAVVTPRIRAAVLPDGLAASSAADPRPRIAPRTRALTSLDDFHELDAGELVVVLGDGGVGKSTSLALIRATIPRESADSMLAVVVGLANYFPGSIDAAVHQELGVVHGTWRTLPDRVLLLCDGLNECPVAHMQTFLDELKPLLENHRVACVITTREANLRSRLVLPTAPSACVQLEGLTPVGIGRIAQAELGVDEAAKFLAAYRALSDRSRSPHFWTPFAVRASIELWREAATLPATLGEILQKFLVSRCTRNSELTAELASTDVILQLAGALAFHGMFYDGRLECPAIEAGKWIAEAKKLCADAFGISDLKDVEIASLLIQHELLRRTKTGQLHFGHQLIAAALSARFLAADWRRHTETLDGSIADDAWVFAVQLVPEEDQVDILRTIFEADLTLGGRAAHEMPAAIQAKAERWLFQAVAAESPEISRIYALHGLANLRSTNAIGMLRQLAIDKSDPVNYAARRALAASGDVSYLHGLLVEMDRLKAAPIGFSGGNVAVWECAPLPVRLDLARQRLSTSTPGDLVTESLHHIAYERDAGDRDIVIRHLDAASDLIAWRVALHTLHQISPKHAAEKANAVISAEASPVTKAVLIRSAAAAGVEVSVSLAFECATADLPDSEASVEDNFRLSQLISDVLRNAALPSNLVEQLEQELPTSQGERKIRIWQLATQCSSRTMAIYAIECIRQWGEDVGYACNFFLEQHALRREYANDLLKACKAGLLLQEDWFCWRTERALALVGELGSSPDVLGQLSLAIVRLDRVRKAIESGNVEVLDCDERKVADQIAADSLRHSLGHHASYLLPAAARARKFLPQEVLLSFLYYDMNSIADARDDIQLVISELADDDVDRVLASISDEWILLSSIRAAAARPVTSVRINLLRQCVESSYLHPAKLHILTEAIDTCWNDTVLAMVVHVVANIQYWPDSSETLFWSFIRMVARHVIPNDVPVLEQALAGARTPFSRRVLTLWRDGVSKTRFELSDAGAGSAES
jgi:energy-coupling factor transporter ATP-binding protein EcfA2